MRRPVDEHLAKPSDSESQDTCNCGCACKAAVLKGDSPTPLNTAASIQVGLDLQAVIRPHGEGLLSQ